MNITKETLNKLKNILKERNMTYFLGSDYYYKNDITIKEADYIFIAKLDFSFEIKIKSLKKEITIEYILDRINKQLTKKSSYKSLIPKFKEILKETNQKMGFDVYPTSYGIGVSNIYNPNKKLNIKNIEKFLNDNNIKYTNEYSDANWVYRFRISQSKENINRINNI